MQQNAFELLKCGGAKYSQSQNQSQKPSKRRRSSVEQQTAYSTCPVCGDTSVPTWFLEQHVSSCLDKPATQTATQINAAATSNALKRGNAAKASPAAAAASPQNLPITNSSSAATAETDPAGGSSAAKRQHQQPKHTPTDAKAATVGGAVNAFAVMTAASAAQVPVEATMFLEACRDGSWVCHWWNAGSAPQKDGLTTAWSATIDKISMPKLDAAAAAGSSSSKGPLDLPSGSTKLKLHLATNVPSGFGTAVDWSNPLLASNGLQQQQQHQDSTLDAEHQQQQQQQQDEKEAGIDPAAAAAAAEDANGHTSKPGAGIRWHGGMSVLISALQKCVRRGKAASATRIALLLLKEPDGPDKLLRRLSIICLEDGLLHPQLPLVVWAMMAVSKGYMIGGSLANTLLSITYQMAAIGHRDFLPDVDVVSGPAAAIYTAPRTWQSVDAALPPTSAEALLIKSILIRAAYGGMAGDKEMLIRFAGLWLARFTGATLLPPSSPGQAAASAAVKAVNAAADGIAAADSAQEQQKQQQEVAQREAEQQQPDVAVEAREPNIEQQRQQNTTGTLATLATAKLQQQQLDDTEAAPAAAAAGKGLGCDTAADSKTPPGIAAAAAAAADSEAVEDTSTGNHHQQQQQPDQQPDQQQDQQQHKQEPPPQQQQVQQLPGHRDPGSCFDNAPPAGSPWLEFLRAMYQLLAKPGEAGLTTHVTSLGPIEKKDIPEAAVDFHVSNVVDHLLQQPPVQEILQQMVNQSTALAARVQGPEGRDYRPLIQQALWLFRSSYNNKLWLQQLYQMESEWQKVQEGSGYARQVLDMEIGALQRFNREQKERRVLLLPLWKVMASRADKFSQQEINKKLH